MVWMIRARSWKLRSGSGRAVNDGNEASHGFMRL
jgi:hypothetical protein